MKNPGLFKLVTTFFKDYLGGQRNVSPHTALAYRDGIKLLLKYASLKGSRPVSKLDICDLTPALILGFLDYLESERKNSIRTRNNRLAMIHTFFSYIIGEEPLSAELGARILQIPFKKDVHPALGYLNAEETKNILESIDRTTVAGRRDYLLLALLYDSGARVQEVLDLKPCDLRFGSPPHAQLTGKGRKTRLCPLLPQTLRLVEGFLKESHRSQDDTEPLFQNLQGKKLSRHGVRYILLKYVCLAMKACTDLRKRAISPHTLRHSKAVHLLQSGIPLVTIKDILGHADVRTTQIYVATDLEARRKALQDSKSPAVYRKEPKIDADILDWLEKL
ncbi:MAG: tyrosine-type recombinase/integrase [Candidatus Ozemobacteraceae bacterium]